ncbi:ABC transporter permease [Methylovulum psychrotolerans]|jgi:putative ABC transport system permease protein|uniref:Multidrug ABC transporter substrate-binding protein n=1 Tax=Methylovulum psychrotolerans TaxID=1704499 RepID=A0A1Z4C2G3_9GAMM|nr:ABC transporter permease [Methylovulum psychrotolerans]ASF47727.1 multidrug ABC transporter substrate-binding protein [Methylovulum psychrotolerans]MBT9099843.1 ABC transporter permease [Methylovulum psychrotolerans]POZ53175.1 multidrug ABC transporter substrate-binding protein [Methylovulum psychrotolerans]
MLGNALLLAFRTLRRNAMRSLLTMLGIIIGVAAVIVVVTLGSGATQQVSQQVASLGSNLLMVSVGKRMGPGQVSGAEAFKLADAEALAKDVYGLVAVAPVASGSTTAIYANENWSTNVSGTTDAFFSVSNQPVAEGRLFTASEARLGTAVCVIGQTVATKLFRLQNPLNNRIRLQKLSCEVIGVLKAKGQSTMGTDQDDLVVVPLRTYQRRIAGNQEINLIKVSVQSGHDTEKVKQGIESILRTRRHLASTEENNFNVMDMKEIAAMLSSTTQTMTGMLSAVGAVSLLVGGIGIMNIMLVSVTERTREIGIRLAIGALENEVLLQFLVEAVVLSSFGGLIGILLALGIALGLSGLLQVPFVFQGGIVLTAFLFSAAVGVVFGYFPARKAARLDPIEALRHE